MENYGQDKNVISMHGLPRFGHSSSLASLASSNQAEQQDYLRGVRAFSIFLIVMYSVWFMVLLVLKLPRFEKRVGCAAGGKVLDIIAMRQKFKIRRWERFRIVQRSWRIQNVFLLCALGVTSFTFVVINQGLNPFLESLHDAVIINDEVEAQAYRGIQIAESLERIHREELSQFAHLQIQDICPLYQNAEELYEVAFNLDDTTQSVVNGIEMVETMLQNGSVNHVIHGLYQITNITKDMDAFVETTFQYDWIVKFFMAAINIINLVLLAGVLLTKNKINNYGFQIIVSHVFIPAFALTLVGTVVATCAVVVAGIVNADFCAGGDSPGSPIGTLSEFVATQGFEPDNVIYESLDFYWGKNCMGINPLRFIGAIESLVTDSAESVQYILDDIESGNLTAIINSCGSDMHAVNDTLVQLRYALIAVAGNLRAASSLTVCSSIRPTLERLAYGAPCTESIDGLAWLFASLLTISILGMTMLTLRAALYNPLIPASKKKRREKEFKQYRQYMSQYGYDTAEWTMDPDQQTDPLYKNVSHDEPAGTTDSILAHALVLGGCQQPAALNNSTSTSPENYSQTKSIRMTTKPVFENLPTGNTNHDEDQDDSSCYSSDSDDSSINPPPSVVSNVASTLSEMIGRVFSIRRKHPVEEGPADGLILVERPSVDQSSLSSRSRQDDPIHPSLFFTPPPKQAPQKSLLGEMDISFRRDDYDEEEVEPLTPPSPEHPPRTPEKTMKQLTRTKL